MIIAIEGPSAVGKTTWCREHCPGRFVEEAAPDVSAPDLHSDPKHVAGFWVEFAIKRWQAALLIEREDGVAICDGSPLHLYYSWALWKSGALPETLFATETRLYRHAIERRDLGFANLVFWLDAPIAELRRRASADTTRRRRRHEMNLGCVPWMKAWFRERERLLPNSVCPCPAALEVQSISVQPSLHERYATSTFDRFIAALPTAAPERPGFDLAAIR
jgi:hypothetical protein